MVILKGPLNLAKFAIADIAQGLAQMIRKVERSKILLQKLKNSESESRIVF